jgi:hypothetical protein
MALNTPLRPPPLFSRLILTVPWHKKDFSDLVPGTKKEGLGFISAIKYVHPSKGEIPFVPYHSLFSKSESLFLKGEWTFELANSPFLRLSSFTHKSLASFKMSVSPFLNDFEIFLYSKVHQLIV